MPVKKLTKRQFDNIYDIARYEDLSILVDELNIAFADIYGYTERRSTRRSMAQRSRIAPRKAAKRKLSAWNKFVKANSKKKEFRYANGKLKLKKMGIAFRKKKRRRECGTGI